MLQQDVARFPFQASELIPSLVDLTLAAVSGHSETPRFGQHPGTDLRLGQSDQQEVSLVMTLQQLEREMVVPAHTEFFSIC